MDTFRDTLQPETIAFFEREGYDMDWDEPIAETVREGKPGQGATHYLGSNGLMVTEFDAAVEPQWRIDGDDGITWSQFSRQS